MADEKEPILPKTNELVHGYVPRAVCSLLRGGIAYFFKGPLPGAKLRSQSSEKTFRYWKRLIVSTATPAILCFAFARHDTVAQYSKKYTNSPNTLKYVTYSVGSIFASLSTFFTLFAAGLERLVPAPKRPRCQLDCLPFDKDASNAGVEVPRNHPLYPFYRETDLVEYVPAQVWVAQIPLIFLGYQLASRMVILKVDKDYLVYSPVPLTQQISRAVDELCENSEGDVKWIIASNCIHHLYVTQWMEKYPAAHVYAAPGLTERRPDINWTATIDSTHFEHENLWDRAIVDFVLMKSGMFHEEIVIYHSESRTLIVSDLIENLGHEPETSEVGDSIQELEMFMMAQRPSLPPDLKAIIDTEMYKNAVEEVLKWQFDRIIIAHGRLIECDARETFMDAFAFLFQ